MKPKPECLRCLLNVRLRDIEYSSLKPEGKVALAKKVLGSLIEEFNLETAELTTLASSLFELVVKSAPDIVDYYKLIKKRSMRIALESIGVHRRYLEGKGDFERLYYLLKLAALGNIIDYGVAEHSFKEELDPLLIEKTELAIDDSRILYDMIKRGGLRVLYLLDNAGEVVYDALLAEYIRGKGNRVIGVAKDEPGFQNDVTLNDLVETGVDKAFDLLVTPGCRGVCSSIHLDKVDSSFKELLGSVDLVIAKGMANFEYLSSTSLGKPVLFILVAKCRPVAEALGSFFYLGKPVVLLKTS